MILFDLKNFMKDLRKLKDCGKVEMTEGMKYIDYLLTHEEDIKADNIEHNKFTVEDLERYRSLWSDLEEINRNNCELAARINSIAPTFNNSVEFF